MALSRKDIKAYLYVLNQPSVQYWLPIQPPDNVMGCLVRLREQLEELVKKRPKGMYWRELLLRLEERERLNGIVEPDEATKAELAEKTRLLALQLYSLYTQDSYCYRKVLILSDGTRYNLSPVTALEFKMFHGGSIEGFKKDFNYKELSDFTPEQLAAAEVAVYNSAGHKLSWSDWNCCLSFGDETEAAMREWHGYFDEDVVD